MAGQVEAHGHGPRRPRACLRLAAASSAAERKTAAENLAAHHEHVPAWEEPIAKPKAAEPMGPSEIGAGHQERLETGTRWQEEARIVDVWLLATGNELLLSPSSTMGYLAMALAPSAAPVIPQGPSRQV